MCDDVRDDNGGDNFPEVMMKNARDLKTTVPRAAGLAWLGDTCTAAHRPR